MKMSKIFITSIAAISALGISQNVSASVNVYEFNTLTRQWADACYVLGTSNIATDMWSTYPYRLFASPQEAYNILSPYAYTDQSELEVRQGFAATGQSITLDGKPVITESTEVMSGTETLTNNYSTLLNLKSLSHTLTITDGATVNTTSSYNLGVTDQISFSIPAVFDNNTSISFTYDFGKSQTQSQSTSESVTLPSQTIPVKPGHTVEVCYVMTLSKGTGNLNINGELSGTSVDHLTWFQPDNQYEPATWVGLGQLLDEVGYPVANGFTKVSNNTVSHKGGSAQYSTTYHTDMRLLVKDVTDNTSTLYELDDSNHIVK